MAGNIRVWIRKSADIVTARQKGRALATQLGFEGSDLTFIATAISEVARNIVDHAKRGRIQLARINHGVRHGIVITAHDAGPGIPDVAKAMEYGYSTRKGLGVGLPGAKSLMDEFYVDSREGKGTKVTMIKWLF
jgi:serine/threonine-protein kinase RsbT